MRLAPLTIMLALSGIAPAAAQETAGETPRLRPTGDLLVRFEAVRDAPNPLTSDFERARIRFRPGLEVDVIPGRFTAGAGLLASIGSDDNEDNVIRLDNFESDDLELDRAWLRVSGRQVASSATVGMFETPFSGTEVLWDRDLRFIGASAGAELPPGRLEGQRVLGGVTIGSQNHEDESLAAAVRWESEWRHGLSFGAAFWHFGQIDALVEAGYARTNRLAPGGEDLLSDFEVGNLTFGWEWIGAHRPLRTRLDLLYNFGADDLRSGFELKVDWGELQARGTWRLRMLLQRIEQDATLAAFGGDEWWFRTRQRGVRLGFAYALARQCFVEASYLTQRRDDLDNWLERAFVDFVVLL
jgi:hypothetical protein